MNDLMLYEMNKFLYTSDREQIVISSSFLPRRLLLFPRLSRPHHAHSRRTPSPVLSWLQL